MLRPTLCLLTCEAVGGDWHNALAAAAAVELLHNFSLIHDDIEDKSQERRRRPTVWGIWGQAQGINAGDAMLALSQLALLRLQEKGITWDKIVLASQLLSQTCLELCEGQFLDIEYEGHLDITIDDYLNMADKKTARLFQCSVHLGAFLGTDSQEIVQPLCSFGRNLGLGYQIRNDLMDIWGEERLCADLKQKKKTLPMVYALEKAKEEEKERLLQIYGQGKISAKDIKIVLYLLDSLGARSYGEQMIEQYHRQALQELDSAKLTPPARKELEEMAAFLLWGEV